MVRKKTKKGKRRDDLLFKSTFVGFIVGFIVTIVFLYDFLTFFESIFTFFGSCFSQGSENLWYCQEEAFDLIVVLFLIGPLIVCTLVGAIIGTFLSKRK